MGGLICDWSDDSLSQMTGTQCLTVTNASTTVRDPVSRYVFSILLSMNCHCVGRHSGGDLAVQRHGQLRQSEVVLQQYKILVLVQRTRACLCNFSNEI
jgi:hypothetical protein